MSFGVGDLVVCVDDSPGQITGKQELSRGRIYTIRGICRGIHRNALGGIDDRGGLFLEEIKLEAAEQHHPGHEPCFDVLRFRPVRKTSIEELRKLVSPTPKVGKPETVSAGGNVRAHDETMARNRIPRDSRLWRVRQ